MVRTPERPRVALLGGSHWHVPLYLGALADGADVVAVSDPDRPFAEKVAARTGAEPFANWRAALDTHAPDLAFVFVRHSEMATVARELVQRGLPFVIEKPGGLSAREVSEVAALAESAGVPATVPFVQRRGPLAELMEGVGRLDHASFRFLAGPPSRYPRTGSGWLLTPVERGGPLLNLGIHFADLFRYFAAEAIVRVFATTHRRAHGGAVEDHAIACLETEGGASAVVEVGYTFPDSSRKRDAAYYASGSAGFCSVGADGKDLLTGPDGASTARRIDVDSDPLYGRFVEQVLDSYDASFAGMPSLAELSAALEIVDLAYESAERGVPVRGPVGATAGRHGSEGRAL
jgi:predicted dehydrogenase